jgi:hypothetical protein
VLDYNSESKQYYAIKTNKNGTALFVKEMADLLLSKQQYHVKTYSNIK